MTLFSGFVRPTRLKLGTHVDTWTVGRYIMYNGIRLLLIRPFIISPVYKVYRGYILFVFSVNIRVCVCACVCVCVCVCVAVYLNACFRHTFSTGAVMLTKLKLGSHMDNGWMYRV